MFKKQIKKNTRVREEEDETSKIAPKSLGNSNDEPLVGIKHATPSTDT